MIVRHPPTVCVSELTHLLEASSSRAWNRRGCSLEWNAGYWARTCDGDRLEAVTEYVRGLRPLEHLELVTAAG